MVPVVSPAGGLNHRLRCWQAFGLRKASADEDMGGNLGGEGMAVIDRRYY